MKQSSMYPRAMDILNSELGEVVVFEEGNAVFYVLYPRFIEKVCLGSVADYCCESWHCFVSGGVAPGFSKTEFSLLSERARDVYRRVCLRREEEAARGLLV